MALHRTKIARMSDKGIAEGLRALSREFGSFRVPIQVLDLDYCTVTFPEEDDVQWKALLDAPDGFLITHFSAGVAGFTVTFYRGGQVEVKDRSLYLDEVHLKLPGALSAEMLAAVTKVFQIFPPVKPVDPSKLDAANDQQARHESTFARLELLQEDLVTSTLAHRTALDEDFARRVAAAEAEVAQRLAKADAELEEKKGKLAEEARSLEDLRRSIDDRDNTTARRHIRDRMLDDVKSRIEAFGVSRTTERKRLPVSIGIVALGVLFAGLIAVSVAELQEMHRAAADLLTPDRTAPLEAQAKEFELGALRMDRLYPLWQQVWLWARLALGALGLAATVLYFVRWANQWAVRHAEAEFGLQQFYVDVNRANWIIESCLEWRKETSSAIPAELLSSITNGLFRAPGDTGEQVIHPADELASALMGSASKLKLRVGDSEVEFAKPGKIPKVIKPEGGAEAAPSA